MNGNETSPGLKGSLWLDFILNTTNANILQHNAKEQIEKFGLQQHNTLSEF